MQNKLHIILQKNIWRRLQGKVCKECAWGLKITGRDIDIISSLFIQCNFPNSLQSTRSLFLHRNYRFWDLIVFRIFSIFVNYSWRSLSEFSMQDRKVIEFNMLINIIKKLWFILIFFYGRFFAPYLLHVKCL